MPILDNNRIYDGYGGLEAGVDGGRKPNLIDRNQCEEANNVIFRGGGPNNRLPFTTLPETFENPNVAYGPDGIFIDFPIVAHSIINFRQSLFQEALYYAPRKGQEYIAACIGGRLYTITPGFNSVSIREIPITPTRNRSTIPIAYMVQAGIYLILQDSENAPVIFDGNVARRAVAGEIFRGRMMACGQGRIVLVGNDGQIYFGDIRDGKGNGDLDMLGFTETFFLAEGFPSALPTGMGHPTAIQFLPLQDSATGVGDCLVFGETGVSAFTLSIARELWKDSQFQRDALIKNGNAGHRSLAVINQDIWFRSNDGWRMYRQARAEVNQWAQIPMSTNVKKWVNSETPHLRNYCSAIAFDNRLITTCTPYRNANSTFPEHFGLPARPGCVYHNGALSLDLDVLSTFGKATMPAWDGHWNSNTGDPLEGLRVLQLVEGMFNGEHRAFAFYLDKDTGENKILEINKLPVGGDTAGKITSRLRSRSMDFSPQSSEFNVKKIYGADFWPDTVQEETTVQVDYRPDQIPFFSPMGGFTVAPIEGAFEGEAPIQRDGYRPRKSVPCPEDDADELGTNRILRLGYEFQLETTWTGRCTMRRMRAHAENVTEKALADLEADK